MSREWAKAMVAVVILAAIVSAALAVPQWRTEAAGNEEMAALTEALFTTWVFPFEILSVLLLGALFAALYVGAKQKKEEGHR